MFLKYDNLLYILLLMLCVTFGHVLELIESLTEFILTDLAYSVNVRSPKRAVFLIFNSALKCLPYTYIFVTY